MDVTPVVLVLLAQSALCTDEGCDLPLTPHNGNFEVDGCEGILKDPFFPPCWKDPNFKYPVGQIVRYFCNPGYMLQGAEELKCKENGEWSATFPRCCLPRADKAESKIEDSNASNKHESGLDILEEAKERSFEKRDGQYFSCPPLLATKNVEFECLHPDGLVDGCDQAPIAPYTVSHLKCAKYYKSGGTLAYRYRKCKPDGAWSTEGSIVCVPDCGTSSIAKKPLVTYGQAIEGGEAPWHASLYLRRDGVHEYICGASLISRYAVLTAAHCVTDLKIGSVIDRRQMLVGLGKKFSDLKATEAGAETKHVHRIITHPTYSAATLESDIAILILATPTDISFNIRPICFPESHNSLIEEYQIQAGNVGTVFGWGLTEKGSLSQTLRSARLPVVSTSDCIDSYKAFFESYARYTNFCAGFTNGTGVSSGDSGGGLVFPSGVGQDQRFYLQGIVSAGAPPEGKGIPGINQYALFTRVGRFSDWIVRTLTVDGYL